ncbi:N-acetylglutamate kinase [Caloramator quimbayensis]|uniref:Acetylglutamate kinase n=1 Tax=Caloramator quimbayensis TaxID=1147123 RepID=A0A1T4XEQ0_9CLOT|nr:acetylglutamate kinase [Caloramator quimbayensis]SKA88013.1 N-acetylglutamate kinase [Caloramator quimbayensis]
MICENEKSSIDEILPLKKYKNKLFVIKYGGSIMQNPETIETFLQDIAFLKNIGIDIIIVHGGGPEISNMLKKLNIESKFINGLRYTTKEVLDVAEMVLSGIINKRITMNLCKKGVKAVGISGKDARLIKAKKKYLKIDDEKIDIGYVGEITKINKGFLLDLISKDYIPVISPIGCDEEGNTYNINADYAASFISSCLCAEKLILLTDVDGIYSDFEDKSTLISKISKNHIMDLINDGKINGGMIPKVECGIYSIEGGTKSVHILNGKYEHSVIKGIINNYGTNIVKEEYICQNAI